MGTALIATIPLTNIQEDLQVTSTEFTAPDDLLLLLIICNSFYSPFGIIVTRTNNELHHSNLALYVLHIISLISVFNSSSYLPLLMCVYKIK